MTRIKLPILLVFLLAAGAFSCEGDGDDGESVDGAGAGGNAGAGAVEEGGGDGLGSGEAGSSPSTGGSPGGGSCPGTIVATWQVDGESFASSTATYIEAGTWGINFVECKDDGVDAVLQFANLPSPVEVGTYSLTSTLLHGAQTSAEPGAFYIAGEDPAISAETTYFTRETEPGELVITEVDADAGTFSGTFTFSASNDADSKTVSITGEIENAEL
jgi:hypothetical protein